MGTRRREIKKRTKMKIICLLVLLTDGCGWKKNEPQRQVKRRPVRRPPPPPTRATPPKRKRRPKKPAKPTKPAPTDFVGEKPRWVEVMQKGPNCVADTTAAVPCKDPLKQQFRSIDRLNGGRIPRALST